MEAAFELVTAPSLAQSPALRLAYTRVRGAYVPWVRFNAIDRVAETLEKQGIRRTGPAWGVYHDLPYSERPVEQWSADLGYPIADDQKVPPLPDLRVVDLPPTEAVTLRYRGDLTSFPGALQFLVEWAATKELDLRGPLLQQFHLSNPLTGDEDRDVFVLLEPITYT